MKRLLLLPLLGLAFAGCTVSVEVNPPTVSNLQNQGTYCSVGATRIDFKFDKTGVMDKLEVVIAPDQQGVTDPTTVNGADTIGTFSGLDFGAGTIIAYVDASINAQGQAGGVNPQAIIVEPVAQRLWVRAWAGNKTNGWVKGDALVEDNTNQCDPALYGNPGL